MFKIVILNHQVEINLLNTQLSRRFDIKDLEATKQILGIEINRDTKHGNIWLSQQNFVDMKPLNIPFEVRKMVILTMPKMVKLLK